MMSSASLSSDPLAASLAVPSQRSAARPAPAACAWELPIKTNPTRRLSGRPGIPPEAAPALFGFCGSAAVAQTRPSSLVGPASCALRPSLALARSPGPRSPGPQVPRLAARALPLWPRGIRQASGRRIGPETLDFLIPCVVWRL